MMSIGHLLTLLKSCMLSSMARNSVGFYEPRFIFMKQLDLGNTNCIACTRNSISIV